jgi:hypothetical protein
MSGWPVKENRRLFYAIQPLLLQNTERHCKTVSNLCFHSEDTRLEFFQSKVIVLDLKVVVPF